MKTPQVKALPGVTPLGISGNSKMPGTKFKLRRKLTGAIVGRWQSRNAKYWLELYTNANGSFGFTHEHGGGYIGHVTREDAFARIADELLSYSLDGINMIAVEVR